MTEVVEEADGQIGGGLLSSVGVKTAAASGTRVAFSLW